jgi:hypothetical protein
MMLDVFPLYNITEFLRALAYFLSKAFALCGTSYASSFWHKVARNPTELIAEFQFANSDEFIHDAITDLRSFQF